MHLRSCSRRTVRCPPSGHGRGLGAVITTHSGQSSSRPEDRLVRSDAFDVSDEEASVAAGRLERDADAAAKGLEGIATTCEPPERSPRVFRSARGECSSPEPACSTRTASVSRDATTRRQPRVITATWRCRSWAGRGVRCGVAMAIGTVVDLRSKWSRRGDAAIPVRAARGTIRNRPSDGESLSSSLSGDGEPGASSARRWNAAGDRAR